jgi:beta-lactam-binding protein with PASTA domain
MLRKVVLGALSALICLGAGLRTWAEDPPAPVVPDLTMLTPREAAQRLADGGLVLERWYERNYTQGYELGRVIQQRPAPGVPVRRGTGVMVMVSASANGPLEGRPPDPTWAGATSLVPPPARPPGARGSREIGPPPMPALPPPLPSEPPAGNLPPAPAAPDPGPPAVSPAPVAPIPASSAPGATDPGLPGPALTPADLSGSGSPDAPVVAERATPGVVPELRGLSLVDAEQRAREADMELYVERVPGHPVGRVLEQIPPAGEKRSARAVVRVNVTAGGDHDGGVTVPAPAVDVRRVLVPELLDRTPPQAERILTDLGLAMRFEEAQSGLPGRVVDHKPGAGVEVERGSLVTVYVRRAEGTVLPSAPVGPPAPRAGVAPVLPTPAQPAPTVTSPAPRPPSPAPTQPAPTQLGVPQPIAPTEGTALPKQPMLALGFSWLPVEGADAYVLEIEERGPSGWLPSVRKPARSAATTVDLERIAPTASDVRWRVRALVAGREGQPSAWITLR